MSDIHIVRDYPCSPMKLWRALTEPKLMPYWMIAARAEGFSSVKGTRFKFIGKPQPGWNGVVDCEVLEAIPPSLFRYSWLDDPKGNVMHVSYRIEPHEGGTRFTFDHTGFTGPFGFLLAKLFIGRVRKKMFDLNVPTLLDAIDDEGNFAPGRRLEPVFAERALP